MIVIKNPNLCFGCPNFSTIGYYAGCHATACPRDNLAVVTTMTSTNTGDMNTRAERTCKFVDDSGGEPSPPKCSVCGYDPGIYECAWYEDGTYGYERNYCPNCGRKVVE